MSDTYNVPLEKTLKGMNNNLALIADKMGAFEEPMTWGAIQAAVRENRISRFLNPGDQCAVNESGTEAIYDVEGIDEEEPASPFMTHELSLVRNLVRETMQFDPPQYLFYVDPTDYPSGLPAGTYNIILDHGSYGGGTGQDGTYQFTTTAVVPKGGGIRHTTMGCYQGSYNKTQITGGKFVCYQADGLTVVSGNDSLATTEGSGGTNLGTTTGRDPQYKSGAHINFSERNYYGSNRWSTSWIRQYLNSDEATMTFRPGTVFSRPSVASIEGFLHKLDADLKAVLGKVRKRYALSIADGYGYEDIEDTVTLCTMLDIFGSQNNSIYEGPVDDTNTVTRTTAKSLWRIFLTTNADRIKTLNGSARNWWLSSTNPSNANYERSVSTSGALYDYSAYNSYGVVPVLHII